MIIPKKIKLSIEALESKIARSMAERQINRPYFAEDEIIQTYEMIRSVWMDRSSVLAASNAANISKTIYYEKEEQFVQHGLAGLFPDFDENIDLCDLEELVLLVKKSRPKLSITGIHRIAEALPTTKKHTSIETISAILESHGLSPSCGPDDFVFWSKIQRALTEKNRELNVPTKSNRDRNNKRETFFDDSDPAHVRLELLRDLFYDSQAKSRDICLRYNVSHTSYYRLIEEYRVLGPWAVLSAPSYGKDLTSAELQLQVILHKCKHPSSSPQNIVDHYKLKCSRFVVNRVLKRWQLTNKLTPVALDQHLDLPTESSEKDFPKSIIPAMHLLPEDQLLKSRKINRHFLLISKKMEKHPFHICDPGPLLLAPLINDLGIVQSFETHGPERLRGRDLSNLALLNIFRILGGYRRINHLSDNKDRSVAFASGIGMFGTTSRFYEKTIDFKFSNLQAMRNDLVARAKELGLIEGMKIAFDFHFKEFYGKHSQQKGIGKGPDKSGNLVPGFRPHIAWDVATNAIISIAYYQGAIRSSTIIRQFCEQNVFPIFDPKAIQEIFMDSEYTKEGDYMYFKESIGKNGDLYVCLKQNKQIKKLISPLLENAHQWSDHGESDEVNAIDTYLPHTQLPIKIVVLRNKEKKDEVRCFGTTNMTISKTDLLQKYRCRWTVENGIKDLTQSYYLDETYGQDPEKVEFDYYCIMVARLAFEYFLKEMGEKFLRKPDGSRYTLNTVRNMIFEKRNCTLSRNSEGQYVLTVLDTGLPEWDLAIQDWLDRWNKNGKNKVLWWKNAGLQFELKNQYSDISGSDE